MTSWFHYSNPFCHFTLSLKKKQGKYGSEANQYVFYIKKRTPPLL